MRLPLALSVRLLVAVLTAGSLAGCGDEGSSRPTAPTTVPTISTPTPAPTPTIPELGGVWTGTHQLQIQGSTGILPITVTMTQNNRTISATWRAVGTFEQTGDFSGTIVGDGAAATVTGTVNLVLETAREVGRCRARATVNSEFAVSASSLRIIGPNVQLLDCTGTIGGLIWILRR